ncbi:MAG TPA: hypothetical protein VES73_12135 [Lamprocystis sp. (in: g-proteobacteria)]|nr:hypothetical protein [Lamprocystis sp. (in: g-proteobacteria)]
MLYAPVPGTMHVHWRLDANAVAPVASAFAAGRARPEPVVRLRRLRPVGGSDQVAELRLMAVAREGAGEDEFRIAVDHGRYVAELGLTNADGGWLLLARSNAADNAAPVRVEVASLIPASRRIEAEPELPGAEPALARTTLELAEGVFPLVQRLAAGGAVIQTRWEAAGSDESDGSTLSRPLETTNLGSVEAGRLARQVSEAATLRGSEAVQFIPEPPPILKSDKPPSREDGEGSAVGYTDLPRRPLCLTVPASPAPSAVGAVTMGPIEPLAYGQAPAQGGGAVQIDAELRISGQAPPGTQIDLFGQPYRVGPGGRFQLTLRVDDVDLLRRALALHLPRELTLNRDD